MKYLFLLYADESGSFQSRVTATSARSTTPAVTSATDAIRVSRRFAVDHP